MMMFTKYRYKDLSPEQRQEVYNDMVQQCEGIEWIEELLGKAWHSYSLYDWAYDGATFVNELNGNFWEVAAFIHDSENHNGNVGKDADLLFIRIMVHLKYPENIIFERCKLMQWTFINVWIHKIKGIFKTNK